MAAITVPTVSLTGCDKPMPVIGMGTSTYPRPNPETVKTAVLEAIKAGYRHFDTAAAYGTEKPLGEAIAEAVRLGLIPDRDHLFITTKLWASSADPPQIVPACKTSLQDLGLEYVDMYLIHMPIRLTERIQKTPVAEEAVKALDLKGAWAAMEECKRLGLTKGIGVSNFPCKMVEEIVGMGGIPPALNQVEMNPTWQQMQLREFCKARGVHVTAYSPLGANNSRWGDDRVVANGVLASIAQSERKTAPQVALRWAYEQGVSFVTKSFNKERMKENLEIFDWELSADDSDRISTGIPQQRKVTLASIFGPHPLILELDAQV